MRTFENSNIKITYPDAQPFAFDKQILTILAKTTGQEGIYIFSNFYEFYYGTSTTATIEIDLTEIILANLTGTINIYDNQNNLILTFDYDAIKGRKPDENIFLEGSIIYAENVNYPITNFWINWYLNFQHAELWYLYDGDWVIVTDNPSNFVYDLLNFIYQYEKTTLLNCQFKIIFYNNVNNKFTYYFNFVKPISGINYKYFEWLSETGTKKSWFFEVTETEYASNEKLSLQTLTNNYNIKKNKLENLTVIQRNCNYVIYRYLQDICFSDEVYIKDDLSSELRKVEISTNSLKRKERLNKVQDLTFEVNYKKYDTF